MHLLGAVGAVGVLLFLKLYRYVFVCILSVQGDFCLWVCSFKASVQFEIEVVSPSSTSQEVGFAYGLALVYGESYQTYSDSLSRSNPISVKRLRMGIFESWL